MGRNKRTDQVNGFLNYLLPTSRASLLLDLVYVSMLAVVPAMWWSIYLVRRRRQYRWHKRIQLGLGVALLIVVALFAVDMRVNGWRERALASPYLSANGGPSWVDLALRLHLAFAVTTVALWITVIIQAVRHFPSPPLPNEHSSWHRSFGSLAAYDLTLTALTGWLFYWLAFVAC